MKEYHDRLYGVTFENRQFHIAAMHKETPLRLEREADNEYDSNAVAVYAHIEGMSRRIGYIGKSKNSEIARLLDEGKNVNIAISDITGGGDGKSFGVNVKISYEVEGLPTSPSSAEEKPKMTLESYTIDESKFEVKEYTSKLLGRTIKVAVKDGHVSLPGFMSGSKFPEKFYQEFDGERILNRYKEKHGVDTTHVENMWENNGVASQGLGNALHYAMENWQKYRKLGEKLQGKAKRNKAMSRNPLINKLVKSWEDEFGGDYVRLSEEFIFDFEEMLCGSIDLVKVIDAEKKIVRIQDYKTDADIHEKKYQLTSSPFYPLTQGSNPEMGKELLDYHWLQLSFYAYILEKNGYTVEGLDIFWVDWASLLAGQVPWKKFSHDVIDIRKGL